MSKKGFTLIEILIVVIILGILAVIAVPQYQKQIQRAKMKAASSKLKQILMAEELYFFKNDAYYNIWPSEPPNPADWAVIGIEVPDDNYFNFGFRHPAAGVFVLENLAGGGAGPGGAFALADPHIVGD